MAHVDALVIQMPDHPRWTEGECIDIFWRLLIMGWLQPDRMTIAMARDYGEKLGHYGRRVLAKQDQHRAWVLEQRGQHDNL